jgi:hypothetical protein
MIRMISAPIRNTLGIFDVSTVSVMPAPIIYKIQV